MITNDDIIKTLESLDSIFPEIEGYNWYLNIPNVIVNMTPDATAFSNRISQAALTDENADTTIKEVLKIFQDAKKEFIWIVGPNSTPTTLGERLLNHGCKNIINTFGMYIESIPEETENNNLIRTVEHTDDNLEPLIKVMEKGFAIPYENAKQYNEMLQRSQFHVRTRYYLSYVEANPAPVAVSYLTYVPNKKIVYLSGAATIPEFRGRGIYKATLVKRLQDAQKDGIYIGIVSADQTTSAPTCRKFGFTQVCEFRVFSK
ncbi:MAG: GNAT family N-acetyltransferase [Calditrichaeota bacterium]|nr:MAG: GNAT family N-acetyltransferase [Calditrichota bacterium]